MTSTFGDEQVAYSTFGDAPASADVPEEKTVFQKWMDKELSDDAFSAFNELNKRGVFTDPMSAASLKYGVPKTTGEPRPGAEMVSEYARPLISGATSVGGAMVGAAEGPLGIVAGGGLGFAAGEEIADVLDEWLGLRDRQPLLMELKESAEDFAVGSAFEAGGQAIAPVLMAMKFAAKKIPFPALSRTGATEKASQLIAANTTAGPIIAKNIDEAHALEEAIPGLRFGRGQATNDPGIIKWERAIVKGPGDAAAQTVDQAAANSKAIRDFITKQKGSGGIEDVAGALGRQRQALETGVEEAAVGLEREAAGLETMRGAVETGSDIRGVARTGKEAAKTKAGELFGDVPQFGIDSSRLGDKIDELSQPFSRVEDIEKNMPSVFGRTRDLLEETGGVLTPDDLQGIRSELTTDLRAAAGGAEPNARKASRISGLIGEVDEVLDVGTKVSKVKIDNPPPSSADMAEYAAVTAKAEDDAVSKIRSGMRKQDAAVYKDTKKYATEIVDSSDDFADWTELIKQGGLNLKTAHMMTDKETIKALLRRRPGLFRKAGMIHAERFAMEKGFDTPDELFQSWIDKKSRKDAINKLTEDLFSEYQVGVEKGLELEGGAARYREFLEETITESNKKLIAAKPETAIEDIYETVRSKQSPYDRQAAKKLKTAQQFYKKEVIEKFQSGTIGEILEKGPRGDKVTNAQIASKFFRAGPRGAETAQEFVDAIGSSDVAREAIEDYIRQDLLSYATNPVTGELTQAKLKTWLSRYKPALRKLGLEDRFKSVEYARGQLDTALTMKTAFDKSAASKLLESDVDTAVKNAFAKGSKRKAAERLMLKLSGDKKAISGLQNSMIDHVIDTAQTTAADAFDNPIVSLAGVEKAYKGLKPAIDVVFKGSPQKLKALDQYRKALRVMQRGKASPLGGGSDTAENQITNMAIKAGLSKSKVFNVVKAVMKPLLDMGDTSVNAILNRAAFDPDFAQTLVLASKGTPVDIIERRLTGHMISLGLKMYDKGQDND